MSLRVGLTGGIGCGKSTVSKLFAEYGAGIIDTDYIAHQLTQSHGGAMHSIHEFFGSDYLNEDGSLNRNKMRALIFSDPAAKLQLENLLHPLILEQSLIQIDQLQTKPYIIIVVPLLFNSLNFQKLVQRVLVVDCPEETQVARVIERSRMNEAEVRQIIVQQIPRAERLKRANDIINNESSLDSLIQQVHTLHIFYSANQNSN